MRLYWRNGRDNLFIRGIKMKKGNITLRMIAAALLFCLVLIPMSSSVSMTQDRSSASKIPITGIWGAEEMRERAIVGISAAVIAAGVFLPVTSDDNGGSASQQ
jgi:hypothetical protein